MQKYTKDTACLSRIRDYFFYTWRSRRKCTSEDRSGMVSALSFICIFCMCFVLHFVYMFTWLTTYSIQTILVVKIIHSINIYLTLLLDSLGICSCYGKTITTWQQFFFPYQKHRTLSFNFSSFS